MMNFDRTHLSNLPQKLESNRISFIARSSFESRWVTSLSAINPENISTLTIITPQIQSTNKSNLLEHALPDLANKAKLFSIDKSNPEQTFRIVKEAFDYAVKNTESDTLVVDITTFRREELFNLFYIMHETFHSLNHKNIFLIYTEAENMAHDWLSRNTKEIRTILGFSGDPKQSKKTCVITMLGHELVRAKTIIDTYDPSKLMIGRGMESESINSVLCKRNEDFYKEISSYYGDHCSKFEFSLIDPLKVKHKLKELCADTELNYVIVPLNNKISCLGACLYALENQDIQICYSEMGEYNRANYSTPGDHVHIIDAKKMFSH